MAAPFRHTCVVHYQLRKTRMTVKDMMSGASAHVQAEIDKAVAHARDEAAAEAEKQAAKRIAEVN